MYNHRKQLLNATQTFIDVMFRLNNLVFISDIVCYISDIYFIVCYISEAVGNFPLSLVEKLF